MHWVSAVQRLSGIGVQKAFTVRTNWLQERGLSAAVDGSNHFETTIAPANAGNLKELWRVAAASGSGGAPVWTENQAQGPFRGSPTVAGNVGTDSAIVSDGIVYIADGGGTLAPTRSTAWRRPEILRRRSTPGRGVD